MDRSFSDEILDAGAAEFDAMLSHRFVMDIVADRLPAKVFDRYLLIEGTFVETAISIFGYAVAKARTIADRRRLIAVLDALANEQFPYFERAFAARRITEEPGLQREPDVAAFTDGMLGIARTGTYAEILTAMFAAEWMYWTWCSHAAQASIGDPFVADWVRLHAEPGFEDQARWLKGRLDDIGLVLDSAERRRCVEIFTRVQVLEIGFHEAPYREV